MVERVVTIVNEAGIHASPAALLVRLAEKFESDVQLEKNGVRVDGKSILSIMLLAAACHTEIKVIADGSDEEAALDALTRLISSGFEEKNAKES